MLPYHQSWLPPLTRSRHTQISTRTLISFERKETLKKKKNSKFQIIHTFIKNFQIFSQFLNLFPQNSVSTFNFHRPILSRFRDIRMKMIFTRFEKKRNILQGNYIRNSLLPKCHVKRRRPPTSCSQRSQTRILPLVSSSIHLLLSLSRFLVKRRDGLSLSVIRRERRK